MGNSLSLPEDLLIPFIGTQIEAPPPQIAIDCAMLGRFSRNREVPIFIQLTPSPKPSDQADKRPKSVVHVAQSILVSARAEIRD
jgi:hypothetical protein